MSEMILVLVGAALVNNVVLSQFYGLCPFLGVSKQVKTAASMGLAVIFVITIASAVASLIYSLVLVPFHLEYLQTIVFILVIAGLVQFVEMFLKKSSPALYNALGVYLPLITTNCAVLGVALTNVQKEYDFVTSVVNGIGTSVGFTIAIVIMAGIRELVSMLPANNEDDMSYEDCTDDLNRVCADLANAAGDPAILLSNIADDNNFVEVKAAYAKDMVTGFLRLNGTTVGAVANRTELYGEDGQVAESFDCVLSAKGAEKAAAFVEFCDAFEIPVVSFTNVAGFKACKCSEKRIAKAAAKLTYAFANATVPKVNVITGKAFGSAYVAMNSKSIGADMTFAWENAQIGMMDAQLAAKIMYEGSDMQTINEKAAEYATLQSSAMAAAKRGYVDNIIAAEDTRKYVIGAFEMLFTKRDDRPSKKHGTV